MMSRKMIRKGNVQYLQIDEVDSWFTSDQNDILDIDNLDVQALEKLLRDTDELESKMVSIQVHVILKGAYMLVSIQEKNH